MSSPLVSEAVGETPSPMQRPTEAWRHFFFWLLSSDHFSYKNVRLGRIIETFRVELMTFASVTEYFGKSENCFLPSAYPFGEGFF
jgi:hypothetical protein